MRLPLAQVTCSHTEPDSKLDSLGGHLQCSHSAIPEASARAIPQHQLRLTVSFEDTRVLVTHIGSHTCHMLPCHTHSLRVKSSRAPPDQVTPTACGPCLTVMTCHPCLPGTVNLSLDLACLTLPLPTRCRCGSLLQWQQHTDYRLYSRWPALSALFPQRSLHLAADPNWLPHHHGADLRQARVECMCSGSNPQPCIPHGAAAQRHVGPPRQLQQLQQHPLVQRQWRLQRRQQLLQLHAAERRAAGGERQHRGRHVEQ